MIFDIYGRFRVEVLREQGQWRAYRPGVGTRVGLHDLAIPADLGEAELEMFLDDVYHELGRAGDVVRRVEAGG